MNAFTWYLHGDECESSDGTLTYYCACCDLFTAASHLKTHSRAEHLLRYRSRVRALSRLAGRRCVLRGGDHESNLIERALGREALKHRKAREVVPPTRR